MAEKLTIDFNADVDGDGDNDAISVTYGELLTLREDVATRLLETQAASSSASSEVLTQALALGSVLAEFLLSSANAVAQISFEIATAGSPKLGLKVGDKLIKYGKELYETAGTLSGLIEAFSQPDTSQEQFLKRLEAVFDLSTKIFDKFVDTLQLDPVFSILESVADLLDAVNEARDDVSAYSDLLGLFAAQWVLGLERQENLTEALAEIDKQLAANQPLGENPEIVSGDLTGAVQEGASLQDTGIIAFDDPDLGDMHVVTIEPSDTAFGTLTAEVTQDTTGTGTGGTVDWSYSVDNDAIAFLNAGETRTDTFLLTITDENGGSTSETIEVTITGAGGDGGGGPETPPPDGFMYQVLIVDWDWEQVWDGSWQPTTETFQFYFLTTNPAWLEANQSEDFHPHGEPVSPDASYTVDWYVTGVISLGTDWEQWVPPNSIPYYSVGPADYLDWAP